MNNQITGLHHLTAIASDAQRNWEFYAVFLGLRLVKQTVNFDAPKQYHLYYGDESGLPGSLLSFFCKMDTPPGRIGSGQVVAIGFSVAANSLEFWLRRMKEFGVPHNPVIQSRWKELFIEFEDFDGLQLELVANGADNRRNWRTDDIPMEHCVKSLYHVTLSVRQLTETATLLTGILQYKRVGEEHNRFRFAPLKSNCSFVDVLLEPFFRKAQEGAGTVHHLAFATTDCEVLKTIRQMLYDDDRSPTTLIDRKYFQSVYFYAPAGGIMEVATADPGFAVDESIEQLGSGLQLPQTLEPERERIVTALPPLIVKRKE